MSKLVIVQGDMVTGKDKHKVAGTHNVVGVETPNIWDGEYTYSGAVAAGLSDFVRVGGLPLALTTSRSTLQTPHVAASPTNLAQLVPKPTLLSAFTLSPDGKGAPGAGTGSSFVRAGGAPVLLDGDGFNTCGAEKGAGNSSVAAGGQDFVRCSA
jgi:hypothetical protein